VVEVSTFNWKGRDAMQTVDTIDDQLGILHTRMVEMCRIYMVIGSNPSQAEKVAELKDKIIQLSLKISQLSRMKKTLLAFDAADHVREDNSIYSSAH
jgi:hypothetical protein